MVEVIRQLSIANPTRLSFLALVRAAQHRGAPTILPHFSSPPMRPGKEKCSFSVRYYAPLSNFAQNKKNDNYEVATYGRLAFGQCLLRL